MNSEERRLESIEEAITPQELVLLWLDEAHRFQDPLGYTRSLIGQPEEAYPLIRLTNQAARTTRKRQKGVAEDGRQRELAEARQEVIFLFYLHERANERVAQEEPELRLRAALLAERLRSLLGAWLLDQDIDRTRRIHKQEQKEASGEKEGLYMLAELSQWTLSEGEGDLWDKVLPLQKESFRQRLLAWKAEAHEVLGLVLRLRLAATTIGRRYFKGTELLYPAPAATLARLESVILKMVHTFEETFAVAWEVTHPQTMGPESEHSQARLALDAAGLRGEMKTPARELASDLVDLARAETLQALGDRMRAPYFIEHHLLRA